MVTLTVDCSQILFAPPWRGAILSFMGVLTVLLDRWEGEVERRSQIIPVLEGRDTYSNVHSPVMALGALSLVQVYHHGYYGSC